MTQDQGPPSGAGESSSEVSGEIAGDAIDVDHPEFEAALRSFYDEYLLASDLHRTPDQEVAELGSGLAEVASPSVVAEADAWRAANEAHGSGFQRVKSLFSGANIVDIAVVGDRATIEDCTAETATMVTGQDIEAYVSRSAQVVHEAGRYRVVDTEVAHEGQIDSPGYGCVSEAMAEQARAAVETMVAGVGSAQADPRVGVAGPLAAVVAEPSESELAAALAEQVGEGYSITSPRQAALEVEGLAPACSGWWWWCRPA